MEDKDKLGLFSLAIEQSPNSIVITDTKGNIEYVNPKFTEITGYSQEEVVGKNPRVLKSGLQPQEFYKDLWDTISTGKEWRGEFHNRKKNGENYWELASISPVMSPEGKLIHFLAIKEDITERKKIEAEAFKAKELAENAAKSKSEFLANMSHEIRTPINAIIGMTNLLLETTLSVEQKEYVDTVFFSADILLNVINDILDFSKIEAGKLDLENIEFDIIKNIENAVDIVYLSAYKKGLKLYSKISNKIPEFLTGDPLRIRQILLNLINNAIKFTDKGEIIILSELLEDREDKIKIKFTVKDTGIGMSKESMDKLFHSFSQIDSSTTRKYGGSGLGLAISKKLVEMMNGEIGVTSEEGKGSTFYFSVILKKNLRKQKKVLPCSCFTDKEVIILTKDEKLYEIMAYYLNFYNIKSVHIKNIKELEALFDKKNKSSICFIEDAFFSKTYSSNDIDNFIRYKNDLGVKFIQIISEIYLNKQKDSRYNEIFLYNIKRPIKKTKLSELLNSICNKENVLTNDKNQKSDILSKVSAPEKKIKILVAEDNETNQRLINILLTKLGYDVDIAEDGKKAVNMAKNKDYDAILMDVQMPNMNGYEATQILRSEGIKIPIISVTANAFKEDVEASLESGMNDHITKPYRKEEIIATIEKWTKN